jgi:hypothetical protein
MNTINVFLHKINLNIGTLYRQRLINHIKKHDSFFLLNGFDELTIKQLKDLKKVVEQK